MVYHYLIPSSLLMMINEIFRYQQPVDISPAFLPLAEQPSQEPQDRSISVGTPVEIARNWSSHFLLMPRPKQTFQLGDGKVLVAAHAYRFLQIKSIDIDSSLSLECNQI